MALPAVDPADRLWKLIDKADARFRKALINAVLAARDEFTLAELTRLLEDGNVQEALERVAATGAIRLADEYAAVYTLSGRNTAEALEDMLEVLVSFDQVNERAVFHMQQERLRYIREFTADQRNATRAALTDGIERGLNPRDQARNFRDSIGLTHRQQQAVINYRRLLEAGDAEALNRRLHDNRFLPKGSKARERFLSGEKPLTRKQIDTMVSRYNERYIKYRSEVIGRTEALRAVHSGNEEMYRQAVDAGQVTIDQLERTWVTARDGRVRDTHSALGGTKRGLDESWETHNGSIRYPGDPDAPSAETIQCRCSLATRIVGPLD
ncbi:head morphogenesis [Roseobacter phage RDJL Phi 1]|uniref:Head morphogenesis protein n=1 Tax=Roseobacter phage RDJL Phi 1 TaxID=562742 RepID=F4YXT1_9CAUD|nr:head morphogenesis [Roseobacter phage RDJL Phi 1]ADK73471.1 head morphogenesis protein [Roseobacter phage RDJL Phi 1]